MNDSSSGVSRTASLLGMEATQSLATKRVLIAGLGGVGSYAAEALARLGIGHFLLVDKDVIERSNLNRQLYALTSTLGQAKTEVARARILEINPQATVEIATRWIDESITEWLDVTSFDFVVDAIDTLRFKWLLIQTCVHHQVPLVSSMGMAERLDPSCVQLMTLEQTQGDPVSRQLRGLARKAQIDLASIRVVASTELPQRWLNKDPTNAATNVPLGSIVLVPATAGLYCASEGLRVLLQKNDKLLRR